MNVLLSGGTGFIGSALVPALETRGHHVTLLSRSASEPSTRAWNPVANQLEPAAVAGFEAVIHLAGESIFGLWTRARRRRIRESRVNGTQLLTSAILKLAPAERPRHFISASAIGYYADGGNTLITEAEPHGHGWLAEACAEWETASAPLVHAGIRVVWMRIGVVLDPAGGALKLMFLPFKLGVGATLGPGDQWFSWISRRDLVSSLVFALDHDAITGPVNATSPGPVTNREFTKQLASALHRPALLKIPAPILRLMPGQMAEQALLASARVVPRKLTQAGFGFQDPSLNAFLTGISNSA
ncbi:MAG: TIGR01777 family oxidoreductase [Candidatus Sumerlaeaceae bacterium]